MRIASDFNQKSRLNSIPVQKSVLGHSTLLRSVLPLLRALGRDSSHCQVPPGELEYVHDLRTEDSLIGIFVLTFLALKVLESIKSML